MPAAIGVASGVALAGAVQTGGAVAEAVAVAAGDGAFCEVTIHVTTAPAPRRSGMTMIAQTPLERARRDRTGDGVIPGDRWAGAV